MLFSVFAAYLLLTVTAISVPAPTENHHSLSSAPDRTHMRVLHSPNWAGTVWDTYPPETFTAVTGTFTVPTPSGADGAASVWVGIDGYTCKSAVLQTGVNVHVLGGVASYDAWYEWYPAYATYVTDIAISAGDMIRLTVVATSAKNGTAKIENLTTGVTVSQFVESSYPLCMQNAEWIVEDYTMGQHFVQFCDFGKVQFTDSTATMVNGEIIGTDGATLLDIAQDGVVLTSVSESLGGVTVQHSLSGYY